MAPSLRLKPEMSGVSGRSWPALARVSVLPGTSTPSTVGAQLHASRHGTDVTALPTPFEPAARRHATRSLLLAQPALARTFSYERCAVSRGMYVQKEAVPLSMMAWWTRTLR